MKVSELPLPLVRDFVSRIRELLALWQATRKPEYLQVADTELGLLADILGIPVPHLQCVQPRADYVFNFQVDGDEASRRVDRWMRRLNAALDGAGVSAETLKATAEFADAVTAIGGKGEWPTTPN